MTTALDAASLVMELLAWVGIVVGGILLAAGYFRGLAFRGWIETLAVVVDPSGSGGPESTAGSDVPGRLFRWLGSDGEIYELPADTPETEAVDTGDDVTVFVNPRRPWIARTDALHHEGRPLRVVGWVLLGIGLASVTLQFALEFIQ